MASSAIRTAYRSLAAEVATSASRGNSTAGAASSGANEAQRSSPIQGYMRHVFGESEEVAEKKLAADSEKATLLRNLELFVRSKRAHGDLLARYNPIHDKTEQERIRLTARRVGLDLPKDYDAGAKK